MPQAALPPDENFLALEPEHSNAETSRVVIVQAPFEKTSSYGQGSANGPRAIIEASHDVELFDAALGFEAFDRCGGIATLSPLPTENRDGATFADELCAEVRHWIDAGKFVATIGAEHTSIVGAVRAHCEAFADVGVLQIDAHSDLREDYLGESWSHACAMARVLDFHDHLVQVGIRSQAKEERECAEANSIPVVHAHELHAEPMEQWINRVVDSLRPNVYVTFDLDAFDPAIMPATGTPEPGGLTWVQADALLRAVSRSRRLVGFDVNEIAPIPSLHHPQFTAAKLVYRLIGYASEVI